MCENFVFSYVTFLFIRLLQSKFFWFLPLGATNLHFLNQLNRLTVLKNNTLNRFEQNNRFKKFTQGTSPRNSTLQKASQ
jgi:hypothetical protein